MIPESESLAPGAPSAQESFAGRLLRGQEELLAEILGGSGVQVRRRTLQMVALSLPCLAGYGGAMGLSNLPWQPLISAVKVPLLFYGTLLSSFPVLFVFNVLFGARVGLGRTFALALAAVTTTSLILGACAPICLVFSFEAGAEDYPFLLLFHVVVFAIAGLFGAVALYRNLRLVCETSDIYPRTALRLLQVWILVFGFVGIQIAWNLRPFVGDPHRPTVLRRSGGNFYVHVLRLPREVLERR